MKQRVICHLNNFAPEYPGSFVDSLLQLAAYCREQKRIYTFCIFPEEARDRSWIRRFDVEGIGYGFVPRTRHVLRNVRTLLRNYDPVIFHSHFFLYDMCTVFLKVIFYWKVKVIWHYHNPAASALPQRVKLQTIGRYLGDKCIAVGDDVYRSLIAAGLPPEQSVLTHNGINVGRFSPNANERKSVRDWLGAPGDPTVFLLLGLDPFRKGVDIFIKAASELAYSRNNANAVFFIVGRQNTRDFVPNFLRHPAPRLSLHIIDPVKDFSWLLNGIDVLVSSSRNEGLPYSVLESMAAGKLILSSDIPGTRETYGKSDGVWLFPNGDWKMLGQLMERACQLSAKERGSLGAINSDYAHQHYSVEAWAANIMELYGSLLDK